MAEPIFVFGADGVAAAAPSTTENEKVAESVQTNASTSDSIEEKLSSETKPARKRRSRWAVDTVEAPLALTDSSKGFVSKWAPEREKNFTAPFIVNLPSGLTRDQTELLIRKQRIDDISRRINFADYEDNDPDLRSPSPEPVYDKKTGLRVNTREVRVREKHVNERNCLIEECIKLDPNFVTPSDYKPPKKSKKIPLPDVDESDHNYIGLIIGPRGSSQKRLESDSKCKISIRGKGATRGVKKLQNQDDCDEPLHVLIQADNEEDLAVGVEMVEKVIASAEDENNEHKKQQLMQLAAINGTLRDTDWCENCGEQGHRSWACQTRVTTWQKPEIKCSICGDKSHPTSDCPEKKVGGVYNPRRDSSTMKNDYSQLMGSLGFESEASATQEGSGDSSRPLQIEYPGYVQNNAEGENKVESNAEGSQGAPIEGDDKPSGTVKDLNAQFAADGQASNRNATNNQVPDTNNGALNGNNMMNQFGGGFPNGQGMIQGNDFNMNPMAFYQQQGMNMGAMGMGMPGNMFGNGMMNQNGGFPQMNMQYMNMMNGMNGMNGMPGMNAMNGMNGMGMMNNVDPNSFYQTGGNGNAGGGHHEGDDKIG